MSDDRTSTTLFILSLVAYSIASIVIASISFASLSSNVNNMVDVTNNWQAKAINDIVVGPSCPMGFEDMVSYNWPGTRAGCWCGDANSYSRMVYSVSCTDACSGYCNWNQTRAGCRDIQPVTGQNLYAWGKGVNQTQAQRICVRRTQETWAEMALKSGDNCLEKNMTKCGNSTETTFCTKSATCPINDIKISNIILPSNAFELAACKASKTCIVLQEDLYSAKVLNYQRGDIHEALPTAQFKINEYSMCKDSTVENLTPGRSEFPLLNRMRSSCGNEGAKLWNRTDSMTETEFFNLNNLTSKIQSLDRYRYYRTSNKGDAFSWTSQTRSYIPVSIGCRAKMGQVINNNATLHTIRNVQLWLLIFTCLAGVVLGVVLPCMLCQNLNGVANHFNPKIARRERRDFKRCAKIISNGVKLIQLPLQIYAIVLCGGVKGFFAELVTNNCSNADTLNIFSNMSNDLHSTHKGNIINIVLLGVMVLLGAAYFFDRKKDDEEDDEADTYQIEAGPIHSSEPVISSAYPGTTSAYPGTNPTGYYNQTAQGYSAQPYQAPVAYMPVQPVYMAAQPVLMQPQPAYQPGGYQQGGYPQGAYPNNGQGYGYHN